MDLKDELWFIEFGRGAALPLTPEESGGRRRPLRQGLSLEPRKSSRHQLAHSVTLDCPQRFRFTAGPPQRPPLRKSLRIDQSVYPEPAEPPEREPCTPDSVPDCLWESTSSPVDNTYRSSFESQQCEFECEPHTNHKCNRDKSSLSATNDTNSIMVEPAVTNPSDKVTYDKHNSFRSTRMRGTSSDRIIAKKRHDQKSVSSLGDRTADSGSSVTGSLFEKHLSKFCKLSKLERSKRSSANALYDQSPTEAFYNKTGSARLSSQELFEKFCSEDFVSLYGHENDNGNYGSCCRNSAGYGYSKSLESSQLAMQVKCSMAIDDEEGCPDPQRGHRGMSLSHASLGAIRKTSVGPNKKLNSLHACKQFDYSTDISLRSPRFQNSEKHHRTHFNFDVPFSLPPDITDIIDYENDDSTESTAKDQSHSAPLLSPNKEGTQFNFDIPEISKNEDISLLDDSPSDATETRNLTLYEEPHSDRTSLSDIYEPCFSSGIRSKRSSIKRELTYKNRGVFDLTNLDFRAIDDESPNTSKFVSVSSPDGTNPSNFDSKSYYSDSVFVSPERTSSRDETSKRTDTTHRQKPQKEELMYYSEISDSTTLEEEAASIMDKIPEIFVEKFDQLSVDVSTAESRFEYTERTLSPLIELAHEARSDSINLSESPDSRKVALNIPEQTAAITSRPSMYKLEPFYPKKKPEPNDPNIIQTSENIQTNLSDNDKLDKVPEQYDKVMDLPDLTGKRDKSMFFKIKKVRDSGTVAVQHQTKCFPL